MASIKIKFRPSMKENKKGILYYQIIHNRVIRLLKTNYKIFANEWDTSSYSIIHTTEPTERYDYLSLIKTRIKWDVRNLKQIINTLEQDEISYTCDDILCVFNKSQKGQTFFKFMEEIIEQLNKLGKMRTAETYSSALRSLKAFRKGYDILIDEFDADLTLSYESYLKNKGLSMNTVSFYLRILRAVFNRAADKNITQFRTPFKNVYTGAGKTVKRAIPLETIKKIKELKLTSLSSLDFTRDMFLFSFYTRGMSFVDMAYLKTKNLNNGILSYRRRKTNQLLHVKWERCMQEIVDKYPQTKDTDYLLPIITNLNKNERQQYLTKICRLNINLKTIAKLVELNIPLTMYVARHSWASIAKNNNIPISVISEGMGHESESTTRIYLSSLDTEIIDKANKAILELL